MARITVNVLSEPGADINSLGLRQNTQSLILVNKIHSIFSLVLALHCHYHCCSAMKKLLSSFSLSTEDIWYLLYF